MAQYTSTVWHSTVQYVQYGTIWYISGVYIYISKKKLTGLYPACDLFWGESGKLQFPLIEFAVALLSILSYHNQGYNQI